MDDTGYSRMSDAPTARVNPSAPGIEGREMLSLNVGGGPTHRSPSVSIASSNHDVGAFKRKRPKSLSKKLTDFAKSFVPIVSTVLSIVAIIVSNNLRGELNDAKAQITGLEITLSGA